MRIGQGYDSHRFTEGDCVPIGGVSIPHDRGILAHSDGDVLLHALTDALLGALALGDIGRHFPTSDTQWKGEASAVFLKHAAALVATHGFYISNIDCTIICEMPKIGPHAARMQSHLADLLSIKADRISVKATTSEKLGFTGRQEGIASLASALLCKA